MLLEVRSRVDEALELDDTPNSIEGAELKLDDCEDVKCCEAREPVAVLGGELSAKLALERGTPLRKRTLARTKEKIAYSDAVRVVRRGVARGWKPNPELLESFVDAHRSSTAAAQRIAVQLPAARTSR